MSHRRIHPALCLGLALSCQLRPGPVDPAQAEEIPNRHERPIVEEDGKTLLWAGKDEDGTVHWFDMTDATVDPTRFQYGIGRDTIASIDEPEFRAADDPMLAERGVGRETPVLGIEVTGEARAYPVSVMRRHEVVNDRFGGEAFAVLW